MEEYIHFNKSNNKIIECHSSLSGVYKYLSDFVESKSQEDLDKLTLSLQSLENAVEILKHSVTTIVQKVAGIESDEVDVVETDKGYKL